MSGFANASTTLRTLLNSNWSTTTIEWPGQNFSPPSKTGDADAPAAWLSFDLEDVFGERITSSWVLRNGAVELGYYEEIAGQGDRIMWQRIDTLMGIFRDAHTANIFFDEPFLEPSQPDISGDEEWAFVQIRIPFRRTSDVSTSEILTLAGEGATQQTIAESAHGLAVGDWVGMSAGVWTEAIADASGPYSNGVVSAVVDSDTFTLTTAGSVKITAHGWTEGPLYLHQSVAGTVTSSAYTTGVLQQVGLATTADKLIVSPYTPQDIT